MKDAARGSKFWVGEPRYPHWARPMSAPAAWPSLVASRGVCAFSPYPALTR